MAEITLRTSSSLTAALSLLDQPPFRFLQKAERPVDLGQGEARLVTELSLPLQKKVAVKDVGRFEAGLLSYLRNQRKDILDWLTTADPKIKGADEAKLKEAIADFAKTFA